ncbi:TPR repeat-containing protein [Thozetella sp. PMI_491]|nr:TPR repeat-containing protein [Thozetella sp. PMI_491]
MAEPPSSASSQVLDGNFVDILTSRPAEELIQTFVSNLLGSNDDPVLNSAPLASRNAVPQHRALSISLAAFNAFLQANVTGPVLEGAHRVEVIFTKATKDSHGESLSAFRRACFRSLETDGLSPYSYIPHIELFTLARAIVTGLSPDARGSNPQRAGEGNLDGSEIPSVQWLLLRIHVWHYKLLSQSALGPGSTFSRSAHWTELPTLRAAIEKELAATEKEVLAKDGQFWTTDDKVQFLLEKANVLIMLGQDALAKDILRQAATSHGFVYALSGALGKRTKFQEKSTSQLVVVAKSGAAEPGSTAPQTRPQALPLNDETLLENLEFTKEEAEQEPPTSGLPPVLADLAPDDQPQLSPLDQIMLLAEATMKDAFSPADALTAEEVLPFAVRVLSDKSTNWQIYTQALLVRSRIELHRSRTMERGVLQMQAVVDQVLVDTAASAPASKSETEDTAPATSSDESIPSIQLTTPGDSVEEVLASKPTSFFPAAEAGQSASASTRLQYIHALSSPPRWQLESELAYAWAGVGSMTSALEIFQRLRLWAEVALCHASRAAAEDEDGRGSSGEDKAKTILRWCLFHRTPDADGPNAPRPDEGATIDISQFTPADFLGPARDPPPPNAPRLFCILGDIENDPSHYQRAWDISKHRFARAQKSLGEYHLRQKDWAQAREAYNAAVAVNRHSPEMWNRLGDINLRIGNFADAAEAFRRSIALVGDAVGEEDARTWSNLGSALYSLYAEKINELQNKKAEDQDNTGAESKPVEEDEEDTVGSPTVAQQNPNQLLSQALAAYRRGASLSQENWQIWDNVVTLGARLRPRAIPDIILALRNVIRIRNAEDALDIEILRLVLNEVLLSQEKPQSDGTANGTGIYQPPRGSHQKAVCDLLEDSVVPLITTRSELWELISRERVWRRDFAGAVDASEKAWRAALGGASGGLLPSSGSGPDDKSNWLENKEAWQAVVERTDDLVSILENYGEDVPEIGAKWKAKARSAIRSVLGKAKESWEDSEEWTRLKELLDGLK